MSSERARRPSRKVRSEAPQRRSPVVVETEVLAAPKLVVFARAHQRTAILAMRHFETEEWWEAVAEIVRALIEDGYVFHTEGIRGNGPSPMMDAAKAMGRIMERGGLGVQGDRLADLIRERATTHDLTTDEVNAGTSMSGRLFARGIARALRVWESRMSDDTAARLAQMVVENSRADEGRSLGNEWLFAAERAHRRRELRAVAAREADAASKVCLIWGAAHLPGLSAGLRARGWDRLPEGTSP